MDAKRTQLEEKAKQATDDARPRWNVFQSMKGPVMLLVQRVIEVAVTRTPRMHRDLGNRGLAEGLDG